MEKFKPHLDAIKKHHFWCLIGLFLLVVLYGRYAAVGAIEKQFSTNTQRVNIAFQQVATLHGQPQFPNKQWKTSAEKKSQDVVQKISAAQRRIMKSQTPGLRLADGYSDEAQEEIRTKASTEWSADTEGQFREAMPLQPDELRKLMGAADGPNDPGVRWNSKNYDEVVQVCKSMATRAKSELDRYQEVLWLYENMATIIARTNQRATDRHNLPLHTIDELAVNRPANLDPAAWTLTGVAPANGDLKSVAGAAVDALTRSDYNVFPVRMRLHMDLSRLPNLLSECANSDLPFTIQGVRFVEPSGLVKIAPVRPVRAQRPRFGRRRPAAPPTETPPEEKPTTAARGSLVEIWGLMFFAVDKERSNET